MGTTQQAVPAKAPAQKGKGAKPPITAHPAFPLVVAMWFAALLGLGTIILPAELIEGVISALGIPALVPAAAPPLGFTGRAALALAAMLAGAGLGLWVARKAAPAAPEATRRRAFSLPQDGRRQPLSAHEDLGSDGFDSVANFASSRRRALAMEDEGRRSDFLTVAPLPGEDDGHGFGRDFDLSDAVQAAQIQYDHISSARRPANETVFGETLDLEEFAEFTEEQEFAPQSLADNQEIDVIGKQVFSPIEIADETTIAEPLSFSPPSMIRRSTSADEVAEIEIDSAEDIEPIQFAPPVAVAAEISEPADNLELVQLVERLGSTLEKHREWSARQAELAASAAHFPRAAAPVAVDLADFGMAAPDDAAEAMASFFAEPQAEAVSDESLPGEQEFSPVQPARTDGAVQGFQPFAGLGRIDGPVEIEDDEDDHIARLAASFSLPLSGAAQSSPIPVAYSPSFDEQVSAPASDEAAAFEGEASDPADSNDASYPSLLEMKNPFRDQGPEFVRVEEPEPDAPRSAVIFPHEEATIAAPQPATLDEPATAARSFDPPISAAIRSAEVSAENERVLREALMNLQRIKTA